MKILLFILLFIVINFNELFCDEKDSVDKYEGTTYIGNIFKKYDFLPEPIKDYWIFAIINTIGIAQQSANDNAEWNTLHEIGLEIIHPNKFWRERYQDRWQTGETSLITRFTYHGILSASAGIKLYLYSYNSNFRSSFYMLLGVLKYENNDNDYHWNTEFGFSTGYKFKTGNIMILPEIQLPCNFSMKEKIFPIRLNLIIGYETNKK
jgi:hypothetical protein